MISPIIYCQAENLSHKLKELQKKNGEIKVESYFPVDTNAYYSTNIHLDSNLKVTKYQFTDGKYILTQNEAYGWWKIARICKKKPFKIELDSTEKFPNKEYDLSLQYSRILKGQLSYKRFINAFEYTIENGFVTQVKKTNRKGSKIKILFDFSGLYLEKNKTWPTNTVYRKNGSVKRIVREIYYNKNIYTIVWKPE